MGGDYYEITPDSRQTRLCALQDLDTARDRNQAEQWIELLLAQNDYRVDHNARNQIKETLALLSSQRGGRSLTDFHMAVQSKAVKDTLEAYLGSILDGERDQISMSRFCVFEMDELYRMDKKTMNGALFYIFGKLRRRLTSNVPTLVTVDEFREALSHPIAAHAFDEFLFEGRKLNMASGLFSRNSRRYSIRPSRMLFSNSASPRFACRTRKLHSRRPRHTKRSE
jgi:type IV secretion system protein TrbE